MTTFKTTVVKSVHIEGKWPFKYEPTQRLDKNARERERYWRKKAVTVKTTAGKKLLSLPVREMASDAEFFDRMSEQWKRDVHGTK